MLPLKKHRFPHFIFVAVPRIYILCTAPVCTAVPGWQLRPSCNCPQDTGGACSGRAITRACCQRTPQQSIALMESPLIACGGRLMSLCCSSHGQLVRAVCVWPSAWFSLSETSFFTSAEFFPLPLLPLIPLTRVQSSEGSSTLCFPAGIAFPAQVVQPGR